MAEGKYIHKGDVQEAWIDYNGHVNISGYIVIFSDSLDRFLTTIGMDETYRKERQFSIFTLEMHVNYFSELRLGETFDVFLNILDYDEKRAHLFLDIYKEDGTRSASGELMQTCADLSKRKTAPFPEDVYPKLMTLAEETKVSEWPKEAGSVIGIRRK